MRFVGIALCLVVIGLPFGIWVLYRVSTAKLVLTPTRVSARGVGGTVQVTFAEVTRLGILRVAVPGASVAGSIGQKKVGGTHAIHLCFQNQAGKTKRFMVSMYEQHEQITQEVCRILNMQPAVMEMGGLGPSWPKAA